MQVGILIKLIVLLTIVLLSGCANESPYTDKNSVYSNATETSAFETTEIADIEPTVVSNFFSESDACVKLLNNGTPYSAVIHSSPAYEHDGNFYISIWHDNKFYRYDKNGNKDFITDGVWKCFVKEDTMYCEDWGGTTHSKSSLMVLSENEKNIIVDDCNFRACSVSFQKKEKVVKYNKVKPRKRAKG